MVNNGQLGVIRNLTEEVNFGCKVDIIESLIISNFILFFHPQAVFCRYIVSALSCKNNAELIQIRNDR